MLICPGWESGGGCAWLPWASAGEVDQGTAESRTPSVRGESREKNGIHPQNSHYGGTPLIIQTLMEFGGGGCVPQYFRRRGANYTWAMLPQTLTCSLIDWNIGGL